MYQNNRRFTALLIALIMAVPVFAGTGDISHAASVSGAKATNYGFRMVRVSWSAVKVVVPQEPAAPAEPAEPVDPAVEPGTDQTVDPGTDQTDPAAPNTDPATLATDPETTSDSAVPSADSSNPGAQQNADQSAGQAADPEGQTAAPAADTDGSGASAMQSGGDTDRSDAQEAGQEGSTNADLANQEPANPADPDSAKTADSAGGSENPDAEAPADPAADTAAPAAELHADAAAEATEQQADSKPVYDVITYKVYRAEARNGKYRLIRTTKATSCIDKGRTIGKRYYYKVVAYRSSGKKYGTSAIVSIKVAKKVTANMTLLMKGSTAFNFRIAAKQKLYQYDTLQGACANGGYAYLTLYNRRVEKCKIVKVKLSDLSVVKVSAALPIYHGNNLTYNTKKNRIVATCCTTSKKAKNRVVLINPKTLKVTSAKNIKLTKKVKKLPKKIRKKNKGFTAIAYNEKYNCYVARLRQDDNIVILNKDLKPLRYVKLRGKKTGLLDQGIETFGGCIYDVRSFKGRYRYCMVTVHTMSGKYVGQMKFPYGTAPGKELQCIFHNGRQFYAGIYYSTSQVDDTKKNHVNRVNQIYRLNNL